MLKNQRISRSFSRLVRICSSRCRLFSMGIHCQQTGQENAVYVTAQDLDQPGSALFAGSIQADTCALRHLFRLDAFTHGHIFKADILAVLHLDVLGRTAVVL